MKFIVILSFCFLYFEWHFLLCYCSLSCTDRWRGGVSIYRVWTRSSILRIILTVSAASSIALVETKRGWITFSSKMLVIVPFLTLIPAVFSPRACLFRSSVTMDMGFKPAFSARVVGITSKASANAWKQYCSMPVRVFAWSINFCDTSISGAPPPAIKAFFLTRHLTTQRASWSERCDSSRTSELAPRQRTETVLPACFIPVILTTRDPEDSTSSTRSAYPSLSSVKDSTSATGLQPKDYIVGGLVRYSTIASWLFQPKNVYLRDELNFITLDILDNHNLQLG